MRYNDPEKDLKKGELNFFQFSRNIPRYYLRNNSYLEAIVNVQGLNTLKIHVRGIHCCRTTRGSVNAVTLPNAYKVTRARCISNY